MDCVPNYVKPTCKYSEDWQYCDSCHCQMEGIRDKRIRNTCVECGGKALIEKATDLPDDEIPTVA